MHKALTISLLCLFLMPLLQLGGLTVSHKLDYLASSRHCGERKMLDICFLVSVFVGDRLHRVTGCARNAPNSRPGHACQLVPLMVTCQRGVSPADKLCPPCGLQMSAPQ
jgi:hypothetical protein